MIILTLLATAVCARSQVDTLFIGDREPTYYYWDTCWWDYYFQNFPEASEISWYEGSVDAHIKNKAEVARYCYSDSSLRVIGVAAAIRIWTWTNDVPVASDSALLAKMSPEYLRLYEVDSTNDSMLLLDQAEWTPAHTPRYKIVCHYKDYGGGHVYQQYADLYEVFFDSAITVHDSFYVGITGNNNYKRRGQYKGIGLTTIRAFKAQGVWTRWLPKPNHYRRKMHLLDNLNPDDRYLETDTNWHTYHITCAECIPQNEDKPRENDQYMYIFPIIDTSRVIPPPACRTPEGLTLVYAEGGVATLMWTGSGSLWELSVCADGCEPEAGTVSQWNTQAATVSGLDTARWYAARVRSVCSHDDSIYYSDWSDSIMFFVPGNAGSDPIAIETAVDRYTFLMPNPASSVVTVASSFRIGEVELYSLNGRRLLHRDVDGMQATLDISGLPAATYIVRITTNNGTAYKKLVVK